MTEKTFKKKYKALQDEYMHWVKIRNKAIKELQKNIKKSHELEDKFYKEHSELIKDQNKSNRC